MAQPRDTQADDGRRSPVVPSLAVSELAARMAAAPAESRPLSPSPTLLATPASKAKLRLARLARLDKGAKAKVSRSVQTAHVKSWLHSHGYVVKADKLHPAITRIIAEWFDLVDEDGSRTLEHHELLAALKAAKIPCSDATIVELIQLIDMNADGVIGWDEFEVFMAEEFSAGANLLSGEYVLPSGQGLNFGVMIGKLKRNKLLRDVMQEGRRRNKWAQIARDDAALGRELALMQEAAEATSLTLDHLLRTEAGDAGVATPRTQLTAAMLKQLEAERRAKDKARGAAQREVSASSPEPSWAQQPVEAAAASTRPGSRAQLTPGGHAGDAGRSFSRSASPGPGASWSGAATSPSATGRFRAASPSASPSPLPSGRHSAQPLASSRSRSPAPSDYGMFSVGTSRGPSGRSHASDSRWTAPGGLAAGAAPPADAAQPPPPGMPAQHRGAQRTMVAVGQLARSFSSAGATPPPLSGGWARAGAASPSAGPQRHASALRPTSHRAAESPAPPPAAAAAPAMLPFPLPAYGSSGGTGLGLGGSYNGTALPVLADPASLSSYIDEAIAAAKHAKPPISTLVAGDASDGHQGVHADGQSTSPGSQHDRGDAFNPYVEHDEEEEEAAARRHRQAPASVSGTAASSAAAPSAMDPLELLSSRRAAARDAAEAGVHNTDRAEWISYTHRLASSAQLDHVPHVTPGGGSAEAPAAADASAADAHGTRAAHGWRATAPGVDTSGSCSTAHDASKQLWPTMRPGVRTRRQTDEDDDEVLQLLRGSSASASWAVRGPGANPDPAHAPPQQQQLAAEAPAPAKASSSRTLRRPASSALEQLSTSSSIGGSARSWAASSRGADWGRGPHLALSVHGAAVAQPGAAASTGAGEGKLQEERATSSTSRGSSMRLASSSGGSRPTSRLGLVASRGASPGPGSADKEGLACWASKLQLGLSRALHGKGFR